jgi:hypothetical protein
VVLPPPADSAGEAREAIAAAQELDGDPIRRSGCADASPTHTDRERRTFISRLREAAEWRL